MGLVTGQVTNKHNNYSKVNICVNGTWYSQKEEWWNGPQPEAGDNVSFDDGGRNYIKNFKNLGGADPVASTSATTASSAAPKKEFIPDSFPMAALAPKRSINRQNALTNAVNFSSRSDEIRTPDQIIEVARSFEAYTTGDVDMEEALNAKESLGISK